MGKVIPNWQCFFGDIFVTVQGCLWFCCFQFVYPMLALDATNFTCRYMIRMNLIEFDALADAINSDLNTSRNHWIKIQIRYQSDFVCMTPKLLWRCFIICFIFLHWSRKRTNSVRKWFQGLDGKDITEFSYQVDSETLKVSLQISSKFQVFFLMCCVFWSEEIYEMKYGMRFFGYCADMRLEI